MMLQGIPGIPNNSGDGGASHDAGGGGGELGGGGGGGFSEEERGRTEEGERNSGGNRWPRQETLALLQIRSDMDVAFRDSNLKGPLWDEVSRKLAELGYHRSAKKCKEKFENVYKYHKRTKEGRTSKADGKTYRFFDQLQALEATPGGGGGGSHPPPPLSLPAPPPPLSAAAKPPQVSATMPNSTTQIASSPVTPFSITGSHQNNVDPISVAAPAVTMPTMNINHVGGFPLSHLNMSGSTNSSSSSTSSDEELPEMKRKGKRKWKDFFGRLMKEVINKQEELQSKFLDTLERREHERMAREEAWRQQEMAKMKRERELLVQERSMAAAKDTAVITFLQKINEQNPQMPAISILQQQQQQQQTPPPSQQPQLAMQQQQTPPPPQQPQLPTQQQQHQQQKQVVQPPQHQVQPVPVSEPVPPPVMKNPNNGGGGGGGGGANMLSPSPSRWPKAEINALIKLRTTLDTKYQDNGPKGPLWEEISAAMRNLGYNRNAKRCKEKWENINKYYKKVKESSKKRPEDSKTCPYFHQLDAIYKERANNQGFGVKLESQMAPIMARPEQQWPLPAVAQPQQETEIHENVNRNEDDYDDEDDDDEEEDDDEGGEYEIVPNKTSSMAAVE